MPGTALFIAAGVVGAILIVAAWSYSRRKRSEAHALSDQLREQFGPEYDRTVAELGNTRRAEAALTARRQRVSEFDIRHLATDEGRGYSDEWLVVQASFVDDPATAVHDAEALVGRVMEARGYPVGDFEQRSADMSVDHGPALAHYRAAHEITLRQALGQTDTEDLRQAMINSYVLFDELVEGSPAVGIRPDAAVPVTAQ